jgi:hypothetical protein
LTLQLQVLGTATGSTNQLHEQDLAQNMRAPQEMQYLMELA